MADVLAAEGHAPNNESLRQFDEALTNSIALVIFIISFFSILATLYFLDPKDIALASGLIASFTSSAGVVFEEVDKALSSFEDMGDAIFMILSGSFVVLIIQSAEKFQHKEALSFAMEDIVWRLYVICCGYFVSLTVILVPILMYIPKYGLNWFPGLESVKKLLSIVNVPAVKKRFLIIFCVLVVIQLLNFYPIVWLLIQVEVPNEQLILLIACYLALMWTSLAAAFERLVERSFPEFIAMARKNSLQAVFVSLTNAVSIEDKYNNLESLLKHSVITDQIKSELKECVFIVNIHATSILNLGSAIKKRNISSEIGDWDEKNSIIEQFLSALKIFSRDLDRDYQVAIAQLNNAYNKKEIFQTIVEAENFVRERIGQITFSSDDLSQVNIVVSSLNDTKVKLASCFNSLTTFTAKTLSRSFCKVPAYRYFYAMYSIAAPLAFYFTRRDSLVRIVYFYFSQAECSVSGFMAGVVLAGTGAAIAAMMLFHWYIAFLALCGKLPGQSEIPSETKVAIQNEAPRAELKAVHQQKIARKALMKCAEHHDAQEYRMVKPTDKSDRSARSENKIQSVSGHTASQGERLTRKGMNYEMTGGFSNLESSTPSATVETTGMDEYFSERMYRATLPPEVRNNQSLEDKPFFLSKNPFIENSNVEAVEQNDSEHLLRDAESEIEHLISRLASMWENYRQLKMALHPTQHQVGDTLNSFPNNFSLWTDSDDFDEGVTKRIMEDYVEVGSNGWKVSFNPDIFTWTVVLSDICDGYSIVTISFPRDYPARPPSVRIGNQFGDMCSLDDTDLLTNWTSSVNISQVLLAISEWNLFSNNSTTVTSLFET